LISPVLPFKNLSLETPNAYLPLRKSRTEFLDIRGLRSHVRVWPEKAESNLPTCEVVFLHGWMDVSASFQFLVDQLPSHWRCVSFDWRGFGKSQHTGTDSYWFADYVADLEFFLVSAKKHGLLNADGPVNLVAHSMGGNVAMLYAGIRPEQVRRLVNLEGTGMPASRPSKAPERYRQWLSELVDQPRLKDYASVDEVAARLKKTNPRLTDAFANFLALHWADPIEGGRYRLNSDPIHKVSNPILYRIEEVLACWREITAPTLLALASDTNDWHQFIRQPAFQRRLTAVRDLSVVTVADTGHMMHHDQPKALAALISQFIE
jgi:pimeloyl-ACP methyl ester carboxylesterase